MRGIARLFLTLALLLVTAWGAAAQPLVPRSGAAVLDVAASGVSAEGRDRGQPRPMEVQLALSRAVPWRAYLIAGPPRLVLDFRSLDFGDARPEALPGAALVHAIRWGPYRAGWSRMVIELPGPARLARAEMLPGEAGAHLMLRLEPVAAADFDPRGGAEGAASALWDLPPPAPVPMLPPRAGGPLRVVLDPGHGGIDPGAVVGDVTEAALMLTFANELAAMLRGAGAEVILTREADLFVPLERRMTAARMAQADIFVSLHADALPEGAAAGMTLYVWNPQADDRAARQLAMRHDRDDLLAGLDLAGTDDEVAGVLMDLARIETQPRSESLAGFMAQELSRAGLPLHRRPVQGAGFSVLKSPDIPSILIELGFLTDPADRARITDPAGRAAMARALTHAIVNWSRDDRLRARLLRQ